MEYFYKRNSMVSQMDLQKIGLPKPKKGGGKGSWTLKPDFTGVEPILGA